MTCQRAYTEARLFYRAAYRSYWQNTKFKITETRRAFGGLEARRTTDGVPNSDDLLMLLLGPTHISNIRNIRHLTIQNDTTFGFHAFKLMDARKGMWKVWHTHGSGAGFLVMSSPDEGSYFNVSPLIPWDGQQVEEALAETLVWPTMMRQLRSILLEM